MNIPETENVAIPVTVKQNDLPTLLSVIKAKISPTENFDLQIKEMDLPVAKKLLVKSPEKVLVENLETLFGKTGPRLGEGVNGFRLTDELKQEIPDHWEKHGDLILLPEKAFRSDVWIQLGEELWLTVCRSLQCRRLARKTVVSQDKFRTPQVSLLYGEDGWVEQIDNGIRYTYDVTKCMFSSGNITEKLRVAKFDCTGETVVDLYAGIGYFTLPYLLYTGVKHLHACEWNPDAVEALQRNLRQNGVEDKCTVHYGDNREVCPQNIADRVNLGLIPTSEPGWRTACAALKSSTGGVLHIHANVNSRTGSGERNVVNDSVILNEGSLGTAMEANNEQSLDISSNHKVCTKCSETNITENHMQSVENMAGNEVLQTRTGKIKLSRKKHTSDHMSDQVVEKLTNIDEAETAEDSLEKQPTFHQIVSNSKWIPWANQVSEKIKSILMEVHDGAWITEILHIEHVKSYAPHVDHVVLDLKCVQGVQ